jgi:hypothetical protein
LAWTKERIGTSILIAVASAVFGVLISSVFEVTVSRLFETSTNAILVGISLLAFLIVISMVAVGVLEKRQTKDMTRVDRELSSINRRLGLSVRFVHSPPNHSAGEVYRISREMIEAAEKEILHLYYFRPEGSLEPTPKHIIETEAYRRERDRYTQTLLETIRKHREDKFFYRRIYQFPEGESAEFTERRVGKRWFEHTKAVLELLADYPDAAVIKTAPLFLAQNCYIIDERYVIWGIDAIDPEYDVSYYKGTLFFDDPHQEFVGYLKSFFWRVDARATILRQLPEV